MKEVPRILPDHGSMSVLSVEGNRKASPTPARGRPTMGNWEGGSGTPPGAATKEKGRRSGSSWTKRLGCPALPLPPALLPQGLQAWEQCWYSSYAVSSSCWDKSQACKSTFEGVGRRKGLLSNHQKARCLSSRCSHSADGRATSGLIIIPFSTSLVSIASPEKYFQAL